MTLYAFSSENWNRPHSEVQALMGLFYQAIKRNRRLFLKNNIVFNVIGNTQPFSPKLQAAIQSLEAETAGNTGMRLNIAANYGGKWDIVQASKKLAEQVRDNKVCIDDITENLFNQHLCLADQEPVDLLIRTGGEQRVSNYLLWQIAYAELYFTDVFWPQFDEQALDDAVREFNRRTRRFGGVVD